jgi:anthranilate phosphoribosyltransferase
MKYDRDPIEIKRNFKSPLCGIIGSGKDDLKTFNISSIAAIVAAGAGVKVLKNGSRAEASVTGTTDVFEKLGANVLLKSRKKLQKSIDETNFGFCDAEPYFPRMVREYLGKFYFVHPLSFILPIASGLKFDRVVFGLANENSEITAKLMMLMGYDNSLVVVGHGRSGKILDEISNIGTTKVSEIKNGKIKTYILKPEDLGIKTVSYKYIKEGSSVEENADIFRKIINSKETGPRRDIVLMNAGALIYISGKVSTIKEGIKAAAFSIDNGNAEKVLSRFISIFN